VPTSSSTGCCICRASTTRARDAARMESREAAILATLGYPDPYAAGPRAPAAS